MYYLIRSIVRTLFWLTFGTAVVVLPLIVFPDVPAHLVVGTELLAVAVLFFIYEGTEAFAKAQNRRRLEFAEAYTRHPAVRSKQNGK